MAGMHMEQITGDPVVAAEDGIRLRLHARRLRGTRTLVDVARHAGLNRDELSRFERGETTQVRFATIAKLLAVYDCSLDELLEVERHAVAPPLYTSALEALAAGSLPGATPQRRAVRRAGALDVLSELEEGTFADAPPPPARRRAPRGTAHR